METRKINWNNAYAYLVKRLSVTLQKVIAQNDNKRLIKLSSHSSTVNRDPVVCRVEDQTNLERMDSYVSDSLAAEVNLTRIGKRPASVSIQDTVCSKQIPIYLESYIPTYIYI